LRDAVEPDHDVERLDDDHDDPLPCALLLGEFDDEWRVPLEDQFAQPEFPLPDVPDERDDEVPGEPDELKLERGELVPPPLDQLLRDVDGVECAPELRDEDEPQLLERDVDDELLPEDQPPP